jgi:hypothetical protein
VRSSSLSSTGLLPTSEEDDDAVRFWAVLAGLAIGPVMWDGGPVRSGKKNYVSFSFLFLFLFFYFDSFFNYKLF